MITLLGLCAVHTQFKIKQNKTDNQKQRAAYTFEVHEIHKDYSLKSILMWTQGTQMIWFITAPFIEKAQGVPGNAPYDFRKSNRTQICLRPHILESVILAKTNSS